MIKQVPDLDKSSDSQQINKHFCHVFLLIICSFLLLQICNSPFFLLCLTILLRYVFIFSFWLSMATWLQA